MKVVLFCGGLGMRLREDVERIPKPMVMIGYRPLIWHLMKYYAYFGHKDFILCLGYRGDVIKRYFLDYDECVSNDFTLSDGGQRIELANRDLDDWRITFVETGLTSNIGQRFKAVAPYLAEEDVFLANYTDNLTDFYLPTLIDDAARKNSIASFLSVKPSQSFHVVNIKANGQVATIQDVTTADAWINGGYFVFRREIFSYIRDGEELVGEPFSRLIGEARLFAYKYDGFWACMDTFKDKQRLEDLYASGQAIWQVWARGEERASGRDGHEGRSSRDATGLQAGAARSQR